jgi:hypothetical protein
VVSGVGVPRGLLGCTVLPWEEGPPPALAEESPPPVPAETPDICTPRTCASASPACGDVPDGCGGVLDCGPCAQTPSATTTVCEPLACTPRTCEELGHECGWAEDGCGEWLRCGRMMSGPWARRGSSCGGGQHRRGQVHWLPALRIAQLTAKGNVRPEERTITANGSSSSACGDIHRLVQ